MKVNLSLVCLTQFSGLQIQDIENMMMDMQKQQVLHKEKKLVWLQKVWTE